MKRILLAAALLLSPLPAIAQQAQPQAPELVEQINELRALAEQRAYEGIQLRVALRAEQAKAKKLEADLAKAQEDLAKLKKAADEKKAEEPKADAPK